MPVVSLPPIPFSENRGYINDSDFNGVKLKGLLVTEPTGLLVNYLFYVLNIGLVLASYNLLFITRTSALLLGLLR